MRATVTPVPTADQCSIDKGRITLFTDLHDRLVTPAILNELLGPDRSRIGALKSSDTAEHVQFVAPHRHAPDQIFLIMSEALGNRVPARVARENHLEIVFLRRVIWNLQ